MKALPRLAAAFSVLAALLVSWAVLPEGRMAGNPASAQTPLEGDLDLDGCVDGRDLIVLGLSYNCCLAQPDCATVTGCEDTTCVDDPCYNVTADIASDTPETVPAPDGRVNLSDYNVLSANYGEGTCF